MVVRRAQLAALARLGEQVRPEAGPHEHARIIGLVHEQEREAAGRDEQIGDGRGGLVQVEGERHRHLVLGRQHGVGRDDGRHAPIEQVGLALRSTLQRQRAQIVQPAGGLPTLHRAVEVPVHGLQAVAFAAHDDRSGIGVLGRQARCGANQLGLHVDETGALLGGDRVVVILEDPVDLLDQALGEQLAVRDVLGDTADELVLLLLALPLCRRCAFERSLDATQQIEVHLAVLGQSGHGRQDRLGACNVPLMEPEQRDGQLADVVGTRWACDLGQRFHVLRNDEFGLLGERGRTQGEQLYATGSGLAQAELALARIARRATDRSAAHDATDLELRVLAVERLQTGHGVVQEPGQEIALHAPALHAPLDRVAPGRGEAFVPHLASALVLPVRAHGIGSGSVVQEQGSRGLLGDLLLTILEVRVGDLQIALGTPDRADRQLLDGQTQVLDSLRPGGHQGAGRTGTARLQPRLQQP